MPLIEALREYERVIAPRPAPHDPFYRLYSRNRPDFSWRQILDEFGAAPLLSPCLHRRTWAKLRPDVYVSTYAAERDHLVIDVRPCIDSGFKYAGVTHSAGRGNFYRFPIMAAGCDRAIGRRNELEYLIDHRTEMSTMIAALQQRLRSELGRVYGRSSKYESAARKRQLANACGFTRQPTLVQGRRRMRWKRRPG